MNFEYADQACDSANTRFLTPIRRIIHDYILCNFALNTERELTDSESLAAAGVGAPQSVLELAEFLQSTFAIDIPPTEITPDNFDTVERIARFVAGKITLASVA